MAAAPMLWVNVRWLPKRMSMSGDTAAATHATTSPEMSPSALRVDFLLEIACEHHPTVRPAMACPTGVGIRRNRCSLRHLIQEFGPQFLPNDAFSNAGAKVS